MKKGVVIGLFLFISLIVLVFVLLTSNIIVSAVPVSSINCQQDSDCILKDTPYCCGDKVEYYKGCYSINETPKEVNCSSNSPCPWLAEINSCECKNNKCKGISNEGKYCSKQLFNMSIYSDSEIKECILAERKVYIISQNAYDGGSGLLDPYGNLSGVCVQGFNGKAVGACIDLNQTTCKVVYRTFPNIWGQPGVNLSFSNCLPEKNIDKQQNKTFNLSNGRKAEIKIMPETASQKAIERLGELGFNITLKEVGNGDNTKAVYELTAEKEGKMLGLFKIKGNVAIQVDAETGEIVKVKKPWWAFLASGI